MTEEPAAADDGAPQIPPPPGCCEPLPGAEETISAEAKTGTYVCEEEGQDASCTMHVAVCGGCMGICYKYNG